MTPYEGRVHLDLGSGDGTYPYRLARRCPDRLFIAVDTNPDLLKHAARQSQRKPERGGAPNLLCLAAAAEELGCELPGAADRVSIILPWGRLLRSVAQPDLAGLRRIAALGQPGAHFDVVFSYDPHIDAQARGPLGSLALDEQHITTELPPLYRQAGLAVVESKRLSLAELRDYPTTWAKRLSFGREREVWAVRALCPAGRTRTTDREEDADGCGG